MSEHKEQSWYERDLDRKVGQITHRDYNSYLFMFNLPESSLADAGTVVDIGAGFSSFCQEARQKFDGLRAIAVDPVYGAMKDTPGITMRQLEEEEHVFLDFDPTYRGEDKPNDIESYDAHVVNYYEDFLRDFNDNASEYLASSHQNLPLADESVSLVLASNSIIRSENKPSIIEKALRECLRILKEHGEVRLAGNIACFEFEPNQENLELWYNGTLKPHSPQAEEFKQTGRYSDPELMEVFERLEALGAKFYVVIASAVDDEGKEHFRMDTMIVRNDDEKPLITLHEEGKTELRKLAFASNDGFNIPTVLIKNS